MNAIKFGKFLSSLRNEKGLTQEELAEKLFIDKRKVSRWECGMSIPDFETIIKLSEILDVTPYEFSICQRLEKEKLNKKIINKFKNIKDFKRYKLKRKILIVLSIILGIFFILTTIYTFKYYGKVEIYQFKSKDEDYTLLGVYMHTNKYAIYNINNVQYNSSQENILDKLNNCTFGIYNGNYRIFNFSDDNNQNYSQINDSKLFYRGITYLDKYINKKLTLMITCFNKYDDKEQTSIDFELIKRYDNKLF